MVDRGEPKGHAIMPLDACQQLALGGLRLSERAAEFGSEFRSRAKPIDKLPIHNLRAA